MSPQSALIICLIAFGTMFGIVLVDRAPDVDELADRVAYIVERRAALADRGAAYNSSDGLYKEIVGGQIFELQRACFDHVDRYNFVASRVPDQVLTESNLPRYIEPKSCQLTGLED